MNRKRLLLVGVIALIVAGVVSLKIGTMVKSTVSAAGSAGLVKVVVAAQDLKVGQQITKDDLRLAEMPVAIVPDGTFNDIAAVVDSKLGVNTPMRINEAVLRSKLGAGTGLPVKIPEGMRAVSVKVNDVVSVAGFVVPGTHVDVLVTGSPGSNDQANVTTSTVLQDVPVLAAGKQFQRDSEGKPQDVPVITLQVSPADAQLLALASSEGRIQLSLRNPADVEKETTVAVHKGSLYGVAPAAPHRAAKGSSAKPPGPAIETYNVEVIRGTKREISKF